MADKKSNNNFGLVRVAAAVPRLKLGDLDYNRKTITSIAKEADKKGVFLVVLPELCLTGYTVGDLFHNIHLQNEVLVELESLKRLLKNIKAAVLVGFPLSVEGRLFNVAGLIHGGEIRGIVPKTYIPGYKEFYEERWFASSRDLKLKEISLFGRKVPIGTDVLFKLGENIILGVEICEDVWAPIPPSSYKVLRGANIIANLSASNDIVGKADYRRELVKQQSARTISGYIYASSGVYESTTDIVFGGHSIIAENGSVLAESEKFLRENNTLIADIDTGHLLIDRQRITSFGEAIYESELKDFRFADAPVGQKPLAGILRNIESNPFVPSNPAERDKRVKEIFDIQSAGLARRLEHTGLKRIVLGLSGGLDSTLALLVAVRSFGLLGLPLKNIRCFTMPGFATTKRTKSNAIKLAEALGVSIEQIDITEGTKRHLKDLKHGGGQDLVFQNSQARYRTMFLMNKANQVGGMVLGTGDLSEIALGWSTYSGDHLSHYNVNASVPKTLVKYLVDWVADQKEFKRAVKVLKDILNTPISPELVRLKGSAITQKTENLIGPYELHDFFLYHFVRWGSDPEKIIFLAKRAFAGKYSDITIKKWLKLFLEMFFKNQWKRSVMPDGPKVGSVSLSPRGDWRMPSDIKATEWLKFNEQKQ